MPGKLKRITEEIASEKSLRGESEVLSDQFVDLKEYLKVCSERDYFKKIAMREKEELEKLRKENQGTKEYLLNRTADMISSTSDYLISVMEKPEIEVRNNSNSPMFRLVSAQSKFDNKNTVSLVRRSLDVSRKKKELEFRPLAKQVKKKENVPPTQKSYQTRKNKKNN